MKRQPPWNPSPASSTLCALGASLLICCALCTNTHAQQPDTSKYRHYRPVDDRFRLTGTNISTWQVARELQLDYVRHYAAWPPEEFAQTMTSATTEPMEATRRHLYRMAYQTDSLKFIRPVGGIQIDLKSARVVENYAKVNEILFHNLDIKTVNTWTEFPRAMHGLAFGVTVPGGSPTRRDTLVAGGTRYWSRYGLFYGDSAMYRRIGLPNGFTKFRISCAFRADSLDAEAYKIGPDEVIAYYIVYRRTRDNQHDCRCEAFVPIDTVMITKRYYTDSLTVVDNTLGYKEAGTTYDFSLGIADTTYDSVITQWNYNKTADSIVFAKQYYHRDLIAGTFLKTYASNDTIVDVATNRRVRVTRDRIHFTEVPLQPRHEKEWLTGDGMAYFGAATCSPDTCAARLARGELGAGAILIDHLTDSDLSVSFHSTRRAPVTFLRFRLNQDLYERLRAGALDTPVIAPGMAAFYADDTATALLGRLAYSDEAFFHKYRGDGEMARRIQDYMHRHGDTARQLWCNPVSNFDGVRVMTGDLDTTRLRTLHLLVRQDYKQIGGPADGIPIFYVNPDRMSDFASRKIFGMHRQWNTDRNAWDTIPTMILGHSDSAYAAYTATRQQGWGSFLGSRARAASAQGPTVTTLARAVTAAKLRYRQFGPPVQVWNSVQGQGWRVAIEDLNSIPADTAAAYPGWASRPPTPEEITCQAWLSLNCGVDGLVFTDTQVDGANWGYVQQVTGKPDSNYQTWYPQSNSPVTREDSIKVMQPLMWTGFLDRYTAVKRICDEIRLLDTIVHFSSLRFSQEQMSVHDTGQRFADMPLLDTLIAERADRYDVKDGIFAGTGVMDARAETFIELSHHLASPRDQYHDAHYLIITNRRTWPMDSLEYDTLAQAYGASEKGLGAIDVRRPIIRLKNRSEALIDSFLVENVGHESAWPSRRVAIGDLLALDWLRPGWGAVYRIRPIQTGISEHGTAWNNAVHGENPSNDLIQRDRIMVYERDSVIYLRTMDPAGALSREWMISDTADTALVPGQGGTMRRRADNYLPAFATLRGDSALRGRTPNDYGCAVVWERRDTSGEASVEMLYIDSLPSRSRGLTNDSLRSRLRLAPKRTFLRSWMNLAPAIVGIEARGFIVAWGAPDGDGIEVIAVRENAGLGGGLGAFDTSRTLHAKVWIQRVGLMWPGDTVAQYPSLAYHRNRTTVVTNGGILSEPAPPAGEPEGAMPGLPRYGTFHLAHLAYQQGWRNNTRWQIMHHVVGADFPVTAAGVPNGVPTLWISIGEHVSNNIFACEHIHPCVAVDSALVGVAWQAVQGTHSIVLRFRDTLLPVDSVRRFWNQTHYRWSDENLMRGFLPSQVLRAYERPSVTQFPGLRKNQLVGVPEGVIVWQWSNAPRNRRNRLVLYRFGERGVDTTLRDGADPTMMLAPNLLASRSTAFTTAGIVHRGSGAERFTANRVGGDSGFYYPGYLINTPAVPSGAFSQPLAAGRAIVGTYAVSRIDMMLSPCVPSPGGIRTGIVFTNRTPPVKRRGDSTPTRTPPPPWDEWGLPPTFFPTPPEGPRPIHSLADAAEIARTGDFRAGTSAVRIRRIVMGNDSLVAWLNTQPYDSAAARPANIYMSVQLVRASDSSILWTGDTVSGRGLGADTLDEEIDVPVGQYAAPDTVVFIRLFSQATPGVAFDLSAGFEFVEHVIDTSGNYIYRRALPEKEPETDETMTKPRPDAIGLTMAPNPVRGNEGELSIQLREPGRGTIAIYDLLGNRVLALPELTAKRPGEYLVRVDLGGLRDGLYLVEVRMGHMRNVTRFTVMR